MLTQHKQLDKTSMNMTLMNTSPWQYFQKLLVFLCPDKFDLELMQSLGKKILSQNSRLVGQD